MFNRIDNEIEYLRSLAQARHNGHPFPQGERTGVGRRGLWQLPMRFDLQSGGFPLLTTKKVPLRWVVEELRWFMSGSTYEPHLAEHGVTIWENWAVRDQVSKFGRPEGELGPVYGHQWRNYGASFNLGSKRQYDVQARRWVGLNYRGDGVDQLRDLVDGIQHSPASTRLILQGWDARSAKQVALPPCHTLFHVKCWDDDSISTHLYQRSCDMFLGVPFNIASYALLTILLAHVTGKRPVEFIHTLGDAHVYDNHFDAVDEQLDREPRPAPLLGIDSRLLGGGFDALMDFTWDDVTLDGYEPHEKIKAPVAV